MLLLECILNRIFPLRAESWGTVSDWVMVIVTGYSLYYLRKTLSSQAEVQKLQQQGLKLEMEKARKQLLPTFSGSYMQTFFDEDIDKFHEELSLTCSENDCYDVEIHIFIPRSADNSEIKTVKRFNEKRLNKNTLYSFIVENSNSQVSQSNLMVVKCEIKFSDIMGNKYSQDIYYLQNRIGIFEAKVYEPIWFE